MYAFLADQIIRFRKWILLLFLLAGGYAATYVPKLPFDFTPQQLFRSTSDALDYREEFAKRFGREDNVVFVLFEAKDGVFQPELLEYLRDLTHAVGDFDEVSSAESIATMEIPRSGESPGILSTKPILPRDGDVTADAASRLKDLSLEEPIVRGQVVSEDADFTVMMVWIRRDIQDVEVLGSVVERIRSEVEARGPPEGVTHRFGGIPHLRSEIVDSLKRQQLTFIPGTAIAYMLVLIIMFRRLSGVLLPMLTVGIASLFTVMLLVLTGSSINIINNVLPSLIFIIGVSDSIHMLVRDAEGKEAGMSRMESAKEMVRHTGLACLLTSTTTAVGFFSLLAADTQILQDFGWQAGVGVMFAYVATLFLLPSALAYMKPVKRETLAGGGETPILERTLVGTGRKVLRHPYVAITLSLAVAGLFAYFGSTVVIDTVLLEVYQPEHPTYQTTILLEEELSGILPVEVSLEADERDRFRDPEVFAKMREVQDFAKEQDIVLSTQSMVDFHQAARAALLGDPEERDVMPTSREQVDQLHLLLAGSPDERTGVNRFVTSDFRNTRILLRVSDAGARAQLRLGEALDKKLSELFPPESGIRYRLTGDAYVASQALDSFIRDLFYSLLLAMVIIFGMMTFVFRSLKLGLISVLPNVIPLVLTFGYMGLMEINLNTTTIIIFAISLGLAVDDTIHFMARFREERERQPDIKSAVLASYNGAGRAIMLTSVMLLIGLVVLLFSDFMPTRYFATLTAITIAGAVLGDLFLLPPILYLAYRKTD